MTEHREVANRPELVNVCAHCGEKCGLRRHIKEIGDSGRYYAVCYDCT